MLIDLGNAETLGLAAVFLLLGHFIKDRIYLLRRFFIPAPIIGGLLFSFVTLAGHQTGAFDLALDNTLRDLLLMMFFTTIGFTASLEMLKKGGISVGLFLLSCTLLVLLQNALGVGLASWLGIHPLLGVATGSVSLTGGHGTAAAFGPLLEAKGAMGALPVSIAAATWGLVAGSLIGGPVGVRLLRRYKLQGPESGSESEFDVDHFHPAPKRKATSSNIDSLKEPIPLSVQAIMLLSVAVGLGGAILSLLQHFSITVPAYLGAMVIAAIMRNIIDWRGFNYPRQEMETISSVSLSFFLVLALMSMRLWELVDIFGPVLLILLLQTLLVFLFAFYITFRIMGRDYDAATLSVGHCGIGLGATPNAMANIQTFTDNNGPSPKSFFVIPIVGSLFIDFINAIVITTYINLFS